MHNFCLWWVPGFSFQFGWAPTTARVQFTKYLEIWCYQTKIESRKQQQGEKHKIFHIILATVQCSSCAVLSLLCLYILLFLLRVWRRICAALRFSSTLWPDSVPGPIGSRASRELPATESEIPSHLLRLRSMSVFGKVSQNVTDSEVAQSGVREQMDGDDFERSQIDRAMAEQRLQFAWVLDCKEKQQQSMNIQHVANRKDQLTV